MKKITANHLLILLLVAAVFALIFAYISQYIFDYQPCILCLYQRQPFFAIIAISLFALIFKAEKFKKISLLLCAIFLLVNVSIAFYHVGVEQKVFKGPNSCSSNDLGTVQDLEKLKEILLKTKAIRCDEPQFFLFGLSMAAWNLIYSLSLVIFLYRCRAVIDPRYLN